MRSQKVLAATGWTTERTASSSMVAGADDQQRHTASSRA